MGANTRDGRIPTTLAQIDARSFGFEEARLLLNRAGFGGTIEQIRQLADWGPERAVDHLLDFEGVAYEREAPFEGDIMRPPTPEERLAYRTALQRRDENSVARFRAMRQSAQAADRRQLREMQRWWLARMIETPRPLEEKLTLFWHGHFATSYRKIENSWHLHQQSRMFRLNAAGNFGELLFGIIRDPAMLGYLDNQRSIKGKPNENLARELMELFSLGVGGYSERDIQEGARALTGYTFEHNDFIFRRDWHDQGRKEILGASGRLDGDDFVRAILAQPRCSEFIAAKLYGFLVVDLPSDLREAPPWMRAAIGGLASEIRAARYDLKPMLRKLFLSRHFYEAGRADGKIKSPVELVVGIVRALRTPVRDLGTLTDALELMGQDLFLPPSVAGWDGGRTWINTSTLYTRQNVATFLLTGALPGRDVPVRATSERYDPWPVVESLRRVDPDAARDAGALAEHILWVAIGPPLGRERWAGTERHAALTKFAQEARGRANRPLTDNRTIIGMLALATAAPEFQLI